MCATGVGRESSLRKKMNILIYYPWANARRGYGTWFVCVCVCVCVLIVFKWTGFMLNLEDFLLTDFSKPASFKH